MRELRGKSEKSLVGSLLLAHPSLRDSNFRRTVILMTAHNAEGAMGVVVNRALDRKLGDLGGDFVLGPLSKVPVFEGGPVQTRQLIIAGWRTQTNGFQVHVGIDPEKVGFLPEEGTQLRAFLGYAGWSAGQLENELKQDSWIVVNAPSDLFARPGDKTLWPALLGAEGDEWRVLADEPEDPEGN